MTILILFAIAFALGPAMFFAIGRSVQNIRTLVWEIFIMGTVAIVLRYWGKAVTQNETAQTVSSVVRLWSAWISLMVALSRTLSAAFSQNNKPHVFRTLGAVGTTAPWFGFAAAQWVTR